MQPATGRRPTVAPGCVGRPTCPAARLPAVRRARFGPSRPGLGVPLLERVARAERADNPESWGEDLNPFKRKDKGKEDAAKKALEEAFQGKRDILADLDTEMGSGGADGPGSRGGGGGGGGGNWFEDFFQGGGWRDTLGNWGRLFMKWVSSAMKTLGAIFLFLGV
ncbi:unnamed protein product, partial [Ostreobium quekettii]